MGIKERKKREREQLKQLIVDQALDLLAKVGVEGLTMRQLAEQIEYSQSKIYEFFPGKTALVWELCKRLSEQMFDHLQKVSRKLPPNEYLKQIVLESVEFHCLHPHSDAVFTLICFGKEDIEVPEPFQKVEGLFVLALKNLNSPQIQTKEEIETALDMIRCLFVGALTLLQGETAEQGKERVRKIADQSIHTFIQGWKGV